MEMKANGAQFQPPKAPSLREETVMKRSLPSNTAGARQGNRKGVLAVSSRHS